MFLQLVRKAKFLTTGSGGSSPRCQARASTTRTPGASVTLGSEDGYERWATAVHSKKGTELTYNAKKSCKLWQRAPLCLVWPLSGTGRGQGGPGRPWREGCVPGQRASTSSRQVPSVRWRRGEAQSGPVGKQMEQETRPGRRGFQARGTTGQQMVGRTAPGAGRKRPSHWGSLGPAQLTQDSPWAPLSRGLIIPKDTSQQHPDSRQGL